MQEMMFMVKLMEDYLTIVQILKIIIVIIIE
jgi:hypothetical protein